MTIDNEDKAYFDDGMTVDDRKALSRRDKRVMPSGRYCPCCGGSGVYVNRQGEEVECDCVEQASRLAHYMFANIGERYIRLSIDDLHDAESKNIVETYMNNIDDRLDHGTGILMSSPGNGTGKTLGATLILRKALKRSHTGYFTTFADLMQLVKDGWKDTDSTSRFKHAIEESELLVIDDIGKEQLSVAGFNNDYAKMMFQSIVRDRVQRLLTTVYTSNLDADGIQQLYSPSVGSLLCESTFMAKFDGADYRRSAPVCASKTGYIY